MTAEQISLAQIQRASSGQCVQRVAGFALRQVAAEETAVFAVLAAHGQYLAAGVQRAGIGIGKCAQRVHAFGKIIQ